MTIKFSGWGRTTVNRYAMDRLCARLTKLALVASFFLASFQAAAHETDLGSHFERVHEAVVTIRTFEHAIIAKDGIGLVPMTDLGSGVLISEDGDVVTAAHLIEVADLVQVDAEIVRRHVGKIRG